MKVLFIDTETDTTNKTAVEIGWCMVDINMDYAPLCTGQFLLRGVPHPITNINPQLLLQLSDKTIKQYLKTLLSAIEDCDIIAGHNIKFDIDKISNNFSIPEKPMVCTCYDVSWTMMRCQKKSLDYLCDFFGITRGKSHNALEDVYDLIKLMKMVEPQYFIDICKSRASSSTQKPTTKEKIQEFKETMVVAKKEETKTTYKFLVNDTKGIPEDKIIKDENGQSFATFENITKHELMDLQKKIPALRYPNSKIV